MASFVWNCSPWVRYQRTWIAPSLALTSSLATGRFGNAGLGATERILVRIEDQAHRDAALGAGEQRIDDGAIGDVEHRDVDGIAAAGCRGAREQLLRGSPLR